MRPLRALYNNILLEYKTHPADDDRITQHHRVLSRSRRTPGCAAPKVRRPPREKDVVIVNNNNNKGSNL